MENSKQSWSEEIAKTTGNPGLSAKLAQKMGVSFIR